MSDWMRCDTHAQAIEWLDQELDRAADEAHELMVCEGFDENQRYAGMQKVYACLDRARLRGLAEIDRAFACLHATLH